MGKKSPTHRIFFLQKYEGKQILDAHSHEDGMITGTQIRDGKSYLRVHLSSNDYYSEGETVTGEWWGQGARRLGLEGLDVSEEHFQALRENRHPFTGAKLTPRSRVVTYHDVVVSAPKSFSIMAQVGDDPRLLDAFKESIKATYRELEKFAAVRVRKGQYAHTEAYRFTGNAVTAVYHHDTSRLLDPQNHAHLVFANLSYDERSDRWLALQLRPMMEESKKSVRQFFYRDLARRTRKLGYEIEWGKHGFRLRGISPELEERFSARTVQRKNFEKRYLELFGKDPSKKRIEEFIKEGKGAATNRFGDEFKQTFHRSPSDEETSAFVQDWRSAKMARSTKSKVSQSQQEKLTTEEKMRLTQLREHALTSTSELAKVEQDHRENYSNKADNKSREILEKEGDVISDHRKGKEVDQNHSSQDQDQNDQKRKRERRRELQQRSQQRIEVLRRYRRGMAVSAALRGHPGIFLARQLLQLSQQARR